MMTLLSNSSKDLATQLCWLHSQKVKDVRKAGQEEERLHLKLRTSLQHLINWKFKDNFRTNRLAAVLS